MAVLGVRVSEDKVHFGRVDDLALTCLVGAGHSPQEEIIDQKPYDQSQQRSADIAHGLRDLSAAKHCVDLAEGR